MKWYRDLLNKNMVPNENTQEDTQPQHDTTVIEKVESYMQGFITAVNARNFDLTSEPWSHADPNFKGEAERPPGDSGMHQ